MTGRHVTTAITMVVLCMILVIAGVVGFNSLFAPLPNSDEEQPTAAPSESCAVEPVEKGRRLRSRQVVVNVYNAGNRGGLAGTTAVPLMLGASPTHALAPELGLRHLLVELGASVPTRGLYLIDSAHDDPAAYAAWLEAARPLLAPVGATRAAVSR